MKALCCFRAWRGWSLGEVLAKVHADTCSRHGGSRASNLIAVIERIGEIKDYKVQNPRFAITGRIFNFVPMSNIIINISCLSSICMSI